MLAKIAQRWIDEEPNIVHWQEPRPEYIPRGASAELQSLTIPEVVISGPAGTGKSRSCLEKLHTAASTYPRARMLICRQTRESMTESVLVTFERDVLGDGHPLTAGPKRDGRKSYDYDNGSTIVVAGLTQSRQNNRAKVMSTDYDMIYIPEATELDLEDYEKLTTRNRNFRMPYQQVMADCNPDSPIHWLYLRCQAGLAHMLHSRHEDNPVLHDGADWTEEGRTYLATLDRLTGAEHARLRLGQWVQASGLVYDVWSDGPEDGNVTTLAEYQQDAGPVFWGADDGYAGKRDPSTGMFTADSHPRVFLLVQEKPDGHLDVFAESYACGVLPEAHIADVLGMGYPSPEYAVVDKAAAELRGRLHAAGIPTTGSPSDVEESIKVARRLLAPDGNNWRRIRVHPRCKHLRAEMASYRRDPQTEKPVKQFDHGPDVLRYVSHLKRNS